ncbi:MAG: hypothetical protein KH156_13435 [Alistipes sp.]|nr:hypothetical protein [Alistipes sp.]
MTPKELYDWAVENGAQDYDIKVCIDDGSINQLALDVEEDDLSTDKRREQLIIY